ncbi:(2Fe-2S)-binding protein [Cohnella abietis]|uniref:Ferric siderophore reductase C-terminal domain-containing protein n=1 Tax=Cohnella abietis TaxID=2507935 RepID=A0A3T1D086_9BACL|nr:(2Fe-2S)-binding protein [Cohnella abietis]BBI31429.1 hypothetical protein KCTCHS21_08280 [Cohnella abietis]
MDLKLIEQYFHISTKGAEHPLISLPLNDILNAETMKKILQNGSELLQAKGLELAVASIGLAFFGLAASKQIVMSQYNRILDLSLDNLTIQLESHDDHAHIIFKITELKWTELPTVNREAAIRAEWSTYFANTMNPLIEAASSAAGLKSAIIWNQYGARIISIMDYLKPLVPEGPMRQTLENDYLLLASMPGETFNRRKNPYDHTPCYIDSPYKDGEKLMLRSSCCMYYKRENGEKCFTCPILKDQDRAELTLKIKAAQ